jgi:phosphoketolase
MPILHLNGYKIANPIVLARMDDEELRNLFRELGNEPFFIEGHETRAMHELMARTLDEVLDHIRGIQYGARAQGWSQDRPRRPMIVLRTPKGWSGPKEVDGQRVEDFWRSHQVPVSNARGDASSIRGDRDAPRCRTVREGRSLRHAHLPDEPSRAQAADARGENLRAKSLCPS